MTGAFRLLLAAFFISLATYAAAGAPVRSGELPLADTGAAKPAALAFSARPHTAIHSDNRTTP